MKRYVAQEDIEQWQPLVEWLTRTRGQQAPPGGPTQSSTPAGEATPGTAAAGGQPEGSAGAQEAVDLPPAAVAVG
jgi:hypothetical protein